MPLIFSKYDVYFYKPNLDLIPFSYLFLNEYVLNVVFKLLITNRTNLKIENLN